MAGGSGTHPISGSDMALWGQNRQPGQGEEEFVSWGSWIYPPPLWLSPLPLPSV